MEQSSPYGEMKGEFLDEKKHPVLFGVYKFFSGSTSGVVSAIILQPMDVIKTKQQGYFHQASLSKDMNTNMIKNIKWQNSAKMVFKERGIIGFWDGLVSPSLVRVTFGVGLYYYLLHLILQDETNGKPNINHKSLYSLAAGFTARSICSVIMLPVTMIKTRMEYDKISNNSISRTVRNVVKNNKRGLFSGLVPTILRDAPNSGLYISIYHTIKPHIMAWEEKWNIPVTFLNLLTGITAGMTATFITHPFDMIKTQMQLNNGDPNYSTFRSTVRTIFSNSSTLKQENYFVHAFKSIYTGGFMRITKRALNSTITWTIYETINRMAKNVN